MTEFDPVLLAVKVAKKKLGDIIGEDYYDRAFREGWGTPSLDQMEDVYSAELAIRRLVDSVALPGAATAYKTVIPGRWPEQKLHDTLGRARAAVGYAVGYDRDYLCMMTRGGRIYELLAGGWSLVHDIPPRTPQSQLPWRKK